MVTHEELSERIRDRPDVPFSVWDGKVRLSIPGYQDKLALFVSGEEWFLAEGALASTHIRFDRRESLHVMDGCQALGLPVEAKYERLYGNGKDVRHIRDGANLPHFFALQQLAPQPLAQRQKLLRWVIFQVLIGNTDAHAKNSSFFAGISGVTLAPAYDLVSTFGMNREIVEDHFAMSIGDAFLQEELSPFEWAVMAERCGLPGAQVGSELRRLVELINKQLAAVAQACIAKGAGVLERIQGGIRVCAEAQLTLAPRIAGISLD